jgi:hypothetical protein
VNRDGNLPPGREVQDAGPRGDLLGKRGQKLGPCVQDVGGLLEREEHRARVELAHRVDRELKRGHDAQVAACAAQSPEQLRLMDGIGADEVALGRDELVQHARLAIALAALASKSQ